MKKITVDFKENIFNEVYLPFLFNDSRFLIFYGGAGSGKSVFIAQRALLRCLKEKYYRLIFCRKIAKSIRNSQFLLFKDLIYKHGLSQLFTIKESTMEIVCVNGNLLMAAGLDDREKIKSIQEPTDIWCEEATEFSKEDILQLNMRLRTKKTRYNQITLSFNPISEEHWLNQCFYAKKEIECTTVTTTYLDNKFLPSEYKEQLEQLKITDENYYKVYALGQWGGRIKGLIYPSWQSCDAIPDGCEIIYGLDFGFNNPTALIKLGIKEDNVYCQQLIYRTNLTNADLISEMRNFEISRSPIYADAAEPQRIEEIYRAGFNIKPANKGKDSLKKGIDLMKSKTLFINNESCDIIKEIRNYKWLEDKTGSVVKDEPLKYLDHSMDAIRYAVATHSNRASGVYAIR